MSPPPLSGKPGGADNILVIVIIISVGAFLCTRRTTSHQKKYSIPFLLFSMLFPSIHPSYVDPLVHETACLYIWGVWPNMLSPMSHFVSAALIYKDMGRRLVFTSGVYYPFPGA